MNKFSLLLGLAAIMCAPVLSRADQPQDLRQKSSSEIRVLAGKLVKELQGAKAEGDEAKTNLSRSQSEVNRLFDQASDLSGKLKKANDDLWKARRGKYGLAAMTFALGLVVGLAASRARVSPVIGVPSSPVRAQPRVDPPGWKARKKSPPKSKATARSK